MKAFVISVLFIIYSSCLCNAQSIDKAYVYYDNKQYDKAATEFEKALPIIEVVANKGNKELYIQTLYYAALSFEQINQFNKAVEYYLKAIETYSSVEGIKSDYYSFILFNLANIYANNYEYVKAEPLYVSCLKYIKETSSEYDNFYGLVSNKLAYLYELTGKYEEAVPLYEQTLEIIKKNFGDECSDYAIILGNFAGLLERMNKFNESETYYLQAINILKNLGNKYLYSLGMLYRKCGELYFQMYIFDKALYYGKLSLKTTQIAVGNKNPEYGRAINSLANTYKIIYDFNNAEKLYLEALQIAKDKIGITSPSYVTSLCNLGSLYFEMGKYDLSESYYNKAIELGAKILDKNIFVYVETLLLTSELYYRLGLYEKAEPILLESKKVLTESSLTENASYDRTISSLGLMYNKMKDFEKSEMYYLECLKNAKTSTVLEKINYGKLLNNLGMLYFNMKEYDKAEQKFLQAIEIHEKLDSAKTNFAVDMNNLALLYEVMKYYEKSKDLYLQSLKTHKDMLGENSFEYIAGLNNLARLEYSFGYFNEANKIIQEALPKVLQQINLQLNFLSENEMMKYEKTVSNHINLYFNSFFAEHTNNPSLVGDFYNLQLAIKNLSFNETIKMRNAIFNCGDTSLINLYNQWIIKKKILSEQYSLPDSKRTIDTKLVEEEANVLEKELVINSQDYKNNSQMTKANWVDIQKKLDVGEVAIEFVSFNLFKDGRRTDTTYYVALVLRKKDVNPQLVFLCEEKQLDSLIFLNKGSDIQKASQLFGTRGIIFLDSEQPVYYGSKLYDLIWRQIDEYLMGAKTIYFSPTGILYKIPFAAINLPENKYLSDKYKLVQLSSTAQLNVNKHSDLLMSNYRAMAFGGVDYDKMNQISDSVNANEKISYKRGPDIQNYNSRGIAWNYLPGTLIEVEYIDSVLNENDIKTKLFIQENATETNFKNVSGNSPQIMHISTHGFYFPKVEDKVNSQDNITFGEQSYRFNDNSLFRSGIILAGANYVWKGGSQIIGQDDGILTAYEVSNLNLLNTKLVVLSACETGLGDIDNSEGVYGLQRAFKITGADNLIVSLWQVPDKETVEFMQIFYSGCLENLTIREAFYNAQSLMSKKYDPYFWASFVLVE